jgi:hypothetical protein
MMSKTNSISGETYFALRHETQIQIVSSTLLLLIASIAVAIIFTQSNPTLMGFVQTTTGKGLIALSFLNFTALILATCIKYHQNRKKSEENRDNESAEPMIRIERPSKPIILVSSENSENGSESSIDSEISELEITSVTQKKKPDLGVEEKLENSQLRNLNPDTFQNKKNFNFVEISETLALTNEELADQDVSENGEASDGESIEETPVQQDMYDVKITPPFDKIQKVFQNGTVVEDTSVVQKSGLVPVESPKLDQQMIAPTINNAEISEIPASTLKKPTNQDVFGDKDGKLLEEMSRDALPKRPESSLDESYSDSEGLISIDDNESVNSTGSLAENFEMSETFEELRNRAIPLLRNFMNAGKDLFQKIVEAHYYIHEKKLKSPSPKAQPNEVAKRLKIIENAFQFLESHYISLLNNKLFALSEYLKAEWD